MSSNRHKKAFPLAGGLAVIALLAGTVGFVRALAPASDPLSAEIRVDTTLLKAVSGLNPDYPFDLTQEAGFITGPKVLETALKRPDVARLEIAKAHRDDGLTWLVRRLHVEFPTPGIMRIALHGERSHEAVRLLNSIANAYVDEMLNETEQLRAERIRLVERGQRDTRHRLAEKRDAIGRLEGLLAAAPPAETELATGGENLVRRWERELATLRIAVQQGEELDARLTAELARLRNSPHAAAVELHRPAAL